MPDIEYSVITSDVIKSFDCIRNMSKITPKPQLRVFSHFNNSFVINRICKRIACIPKQTYTTVANARYYIKANF